MSAEVLSALHALEHDYYEGVGFKRLQRQVLAISHAIVGLDDDDPIRQACEAFAPTLWGDKSGSAVRVEAIATALAGENAAGYLQAWANFARVAETYRVAA